MQSEDPTSERLIIPIHEETIETRLRPVETGTIRIRTRVEMAPFETTVNAGRDEVTIERVRVDRPVDLAPEPWQEGDTFVIPVVEEIIVTETRLVVREEVRITRRRITEQLPVHETVRREVVELEHIPAADSTTPPGA